MISCRLSFRSTRWKEVGGVPGEVEQVLDDPGDPVGLGLDLLQDLGEVGVGELLLEHLDVARDAGQRGVDLVGHARREEPDRGQLLRGQELLLEADLLGDVLEDDDRPVGIQAVVEERRLGDVEDPLRPAGQLQRDLAQEAEVLLGVGREDGREVLRPRGRPRALAEDAPPSSGRTALEDPVPADDGPRLVEDGDARRSGSR